MAWAKPRPTAWIASEALVSTPKVAGQRQHPCIRTSWSTGFEAERVIGTWMTFYSDVRPHSALGGRTPAEAYGEERAA